LLIPIDDLKSGLSLGTRLLQVALTASAIVLAKGISVSGVSSPFVLAYTAEGFPLDVESEMNQVREMLDQAQRKKSIDVESPTGTDLWLNLLSDAAPESMIVRVGVAPKDVGKFALAQADVLESSSCLIDIASGLTYAVASPKEAELALIWLDGLRKPAFASGGYAAVMQMPDAWRAKIDEQGYQSDTADLQRALKSHWDPTDTLL
jgi:D-lactate dehydrogenase (cytochrome)